MVDAPVDQAEAAVHAIERAAALINLDQLVRRLERATRRVEAGAPPCEARTVTQSDAQNDEQNETPSEASLAALVGRLERALSLPQTCEHTREQKNARDGDAGYLLDEPLTPRSPGVPAGLVAQYIM